MDAGGGGLKILIGRSSKSVVVASRFTPVSQLPDQITVALERSGALLRIAS